MDVNCCNIHIEYCLCESECLGSKDFRMAFMLKLCRIRFGVCGQ